LIKIMILFQIVAQDTCKLPASQAQMHNMLYLINKQKSGEGPEADPVPGPVTGQGSYVSGNIFQEQRDGREVQKWFGGLPVSVGDGQAQVCQGRPGGFEVHMMAARNAEFAGDLGEHGAIIDIDDGWDLGPIQRGKACLKKDDPTARDRRRMGLGWWGEGVAP
jgi:hypothetical protein